MTVLLPRGVWIWLDQSINALHRIETQLTRIADALEEKEAGDLRSEETAGRP